MSEPAELQQPEPQRAPLPRIGDADRDRAVDALQVHLAQGRLDREEFDERLSRALVARTAADLQPLFVDLPDPRPGTGLAPVPPSPLPWSQGTPVASAPPAVIPDARQHSWNSSNSPRTASCTGSFTADISPLRGSRWRSYSSRSCFVISSVKER